VSWDMVKKRSHRPREYEGYVPFGIAPVGTFPSPCLFLREVSSAPRDVCLAPVSESSSSKPREPLSGASHPRGASSQGKLGRPWNLDEKVSGCCPYRAFQEDPGHRRNSDERTRCSPGSASMLVSSRSATTVSSTPYQVKRREDKPDETFLSHPHDWKSHKSLRDTASAGLSIG
jgi:hypothetical protein